MKFYRTVLCMACSATLCASAHAGEERWRSKWRDDAFAEARQTLTDKMYRDLRYDGEDTVPLRRVMLVFFSPDPTPRQVRRLMDYDPNEDGQVERDEMYHGLTAFVFFQVNRHMSLDADEDGKLTREEHGLQVAVREGERIEDGFSRSQRRYFEDSDLNGDGVVTREEVIKGFSTSYVKSYGGYLMGYKAMTSDVNADGEVDLAEFAALLGEDAPNERVRTAFREKLKVSDGSISTVRIHDQFARLTIEEQAEFEGPIDAFWKQHRKVSDDT